MGSSFIEQCAFYHVAALIVFTSWAVGGEIYWATPVIKFVGSLGALVTLAAWRRRRSNETALPRLAFAPLIPWCCYNGLVIASTLNPSHVPRLNEGDWMLIPRNYIGWLPSSALPSQSLHELWLRDAIFLPAFNLYLCVFRRRTFRQLFLLVALNGMALSVFGIFQKFSRTDLWFGLLKSPNTSFFSTFVYHNHWGAYAVLVLGSACGAFFYYRRKFAQTQFTRSPVPALGIGLFIVFTTLPFSASRSCTLLGVVLVFAAIYHYVRKSQGAHQGNSKRVIQPLLITALLSALILSLVYYLTAPVVQMRLDKTKEQFAEMREAGTIGTRRQLYTDTFRMAKDKLSFGWGLDTYGSIFRLYNRQVPRDNLEIYYNHAHSDWLQALAETGITGVFLLLGVAAIPLAATPWLLTKSEIVRYTLLACGLISLYALVEFPFACAAVVLLFWVLFFSALKYAHLDFSRSR